MTRLYDLTDLPVEPAERERIRAGGFTNPRPFAVERSVISYVREWAGHEPDRTAVVAADRTQGYAQLAHNASDLARTLAAHGVRDGSVVAVAGVREANVVGVFLAIESLNAVYMPIGPDWPGSRVEAVLQDSGARVMVEPSGPDGTPVVSAVAMRTGRVAAGASYLIYTSGSTGTPKGVIVEHSGMMNHLWAKAADLRLSEMDAVALTAPLTFDISVWQMLAALVVGGRVVVIGEKETAFARRLLAAIVAGGVTVAQFVPSVLWWVAEEIRRNPAAIDGLRLDRLLSIGEKLPVRLAEDLVRLLPGTALINSYGPTECSDGVSHHWVTPGDLVRDHIPIGSPLGNCALYVLREADGRWRAAEPGESGELFIGGAGVGGGYVRRPELVRQAFFADVADPDSPTGRLFRTRDEVRLTPDRRIEFLQRVDRQVKIAGVRIELGEVEAVLQRHARVSSCVVTASDRADVGDALGAQRQLLAYYVSDGDVPTRELEDHVRSHLPAGMVPRRWVRLTAMPLTPHGKVDYAALPTGRVNAGMG